MEWILIGGRNHAKASSCELACRGHADHPVREILDDHDFLWAHPGPLAAEERTQIARRAQRLERLRLIEAVIDADLLCGSMNLIGLFPASP